jgi:hypothetical protein
VSVGEGEEQSALVSIEVIVALCVMLIKRECYTVSSVTAFVIFN